MIPLSVLDLAHITVGSSAADAFRNSRDLARHAERWGYRRFWLAEHHNMTGIASAATAVVIGHVAAGTSTIRVGAGGIMLPNHPPLMVAEQFGTLDALFPGRIDLGLGRAPGTDQRTARALRRDDARAEAFPQEVQELQAFLGPVEPGQAVRAVPGGNSHVPIWILGSSLYGAQVAAAFGLPYAFASHFAPEQLMRALQVYRAGFEPSGQCARPHAMVGVNIVAADTDAEARRLFTSPQQAFTNMFRGARGQLQPPIDDIESYWNPMEKMQAMRMLACSIVGGPDTVRRELEALVHRTAADELIVAAAIYDHAARLRSYEILAEVAGRLAPARAAAGAR
ncbi:MAG: LLM class flavin-dependent oxidoreductase [Alphaproteobacteria bacterium]